MIVFVRFVTKIIQMRGWNCSLSTQISKFSSKTIKSFEEVKVFLSRHSTNFAADGTKAFKIYANFVGGMYDKQVPKTILTFYSDILMNATQKLCAN